MNALLAFAARRLGVKTWFAPRPALPLAAKAIPKRAPIAASAPTVAAAPTAAPAPTAPPACPPTDLGVLTTGKHSATGRLWRLAFALPSEAQPLAPSVAMVHRRIRNNITAMLQVDALNPNYFPRRPTLLPQLLQAIDDPHVASEKLSRMIAHDPVLTADVLRLANSARYRTSTTAVETIQRAIAVCGVDALRGMLASALMGPVFRATRDNFPRFPRMLWERTEHAARAAEAYALEAAPHDRFEAQLVVLLNALGPLVVYSATLDIFARNPHFKPSGELCVELIGAWAPQMSQRIARDWEMSSRLLAALQELPEEPLTAALNMGELLGTLAYLESATVISRDARLEMISGAGVAGASTDKIWARLTEKP